MAEEVDFDLGDNVDKTTFDQILDMDEDEDRDFSKSIVLVSWNKQNRHLVRWMQNCHFLKGSSATLGFNKVKDQCEKIQNYGHNKNETGEVDEPDDKKCLQLIGESLAEAKRAYAVVNELMKQFYADV